MEIEMARNGALQHAVDGSEGVDRNGSSDTGKHTAGVNDGAGELTQGAVAEKQSEGTRAGELLMGLAAGVRIFRAGDGRFHARVPVNGRHEILGLKSMAFRDWLIDAYFSAHQKLRLSGLCTACSMHSRHVLDLRSTCRRCMYGSASARKTTGRLYLDLGDSSGRVIKIDASGWSIVDRPGVNFKRPQGLLPLPLPSREGSIELLRPFVNVTESDFHLLIGWMAAALAAGGAVRGAGNPRRTRVGQEYSGQGYPAVDRPPDGPTACRAARHAGPDGHGDERLAAGL